ncbi:MAG: ABC transporter ATP-binding protein [Clostridium sp.]|jgi:ABC-2 type transport system ATP-binding protein|uniref:ABC transporter ATP-binding protein n=1 Tax=Clostridium sp. TaxID=1506 RepID=UPI0025B82FAA|nr:ABC transporter ATP-binding protein [Clostridium sp.]MCH3963389.1 ABC transporter ATP-binding protein [Clostridium sp.]MCI1716743.1 ABC transporter ATP-binding protein [Clostridium sp.]MCI1801073.1 ABC transporter ATP-binding protein [Clostridium sp.]MCI1814929.1 ABC transporter ATP-binding protein [Clostridium sp.]MCI1871830.1 ABC transporter ATP-binding protein [Clostridium sp.]
MSILSVMDLNKKYERFELSNVSFSLEKGTITGFIGRNGAGKTTTLKSLLNFVHPDRGEIVFFSRKFKDSEFEIKQKVGFVSGGINYYPKKKIKVISATTRRFYKQWDNRAYSHYMDMFKLDENKTPDELSEGMKVKYSLALALSHNAELLILDEPTSGLDPVSRDDLLGVFLELEAKGITILFSTHITSDLDKCADNILYIKNGKILANAHMNSFLSQYRVLELTEEQLTDDLKLKLIGCKKSKYGYSALIKTADCRNVNAKMSDVDLESAMVHLERE